MTIQHEDQKVKSQNHRWLTLYPQDVPILMQTKYSVHIIVFEVVTSYDDIFPPCIFLNGLILNTEFYIESMVEIALSCIDKVPAGRPNV